MLCASNLSVGLTNLTLLAVQRFICKRTHRTGKRRFSIIVVNISWISGAEAKGVRPVRGDSMLTIERAEAEMYKETIFKLQNLLASI